MDNKAATASKDMVSRAMVNSVALVDSSRRRLKAHLQARTHSESKVDVA